MMVDIRVNTEVAILSFTHLQVLISWHADVIDRNSNKINGRQLRHRETFYAIRVFTVSAGPKTTPNKIVEPVSA